jgi:hypothetical protein
VQEAEGVNVQRRYPFLLAPLAHFDGTELQPWPEPQRYTCLEKGNDGGLYRFLSLDGRFKADLPVDTDGLVFDYPAVQEGLTLAATS